MNPPRELVDAAPTTWNWLYDKQQHPKLYADKWFLRGDVWVIKRVKYMLGRYEKEAAQPKKKKTKTTTPTSSRSDADKMEEILCTIDPTKLQQWKRDFLDVTTSRADLVQERLQLNTEYAKAFKEGDEVVSWGKASMVIGRIVHIGRIEQIQQKHIHTCTMMDADNNTYVSCFLTFDNGNTGRAACQVVEHLIPGQDLRGWDRKTKLSNTNITLVLRRIQVQKLMIALLSAKDIPRLCAAGCVLPMLPKDLLRSMCSRLV